MRTNVALLAALMITAPARALDDAARLSAMIPADIDLVVFQHAELIRRDHPEIFASGPIASMLGGLAAKLKTDPREFPGASAFALAGRIRENEQRFLIPVVREIAEPAAPAAAAAAAAASRIGGETRPEAYRGVEFHMVKNRAGTWEGAYADLAGGRDHLLAWDGYAHHLLTKEAVDVLSGAGTSFRDAPPDAGSTWVDDMTYLSGFLRKNAHVMQAMRALGLGFLAPARHATGHLLIEAEAPGLVNLSVFFAVDSDPQAEELAAKLGEHLGALAARLPAGSPLREAVEGVEFDRANGMVHAQTRVTHEDLKAILEGRLLG